MRCEKVEREKSDILLRRLSSMDSVSNSKSTSSEVMKLQKSIKELQAKNEGNLNDNSLFKSRISLKK